MAEQPKVFDYLKNRNNISKTRHTKLIIRKQNLKKKILNFFAKIFLAAGAGGALGGAVGCCLGEEEYRYGYRRRRGSSRIWYRFIF